VQVRANKSSIGKYLDLLAAVKDDPNAAVITAALGGYDAAYVRIAATAEEKDALAAWVRTTFAPVYAKLGPPTESDSSNKRELRARLFATLGNAKDPAILSQAREIAYKYVADPSSIDATFGQTALAIAARNGDAALFDKLKRISETSTNPEIQSGALRLLAEFEDPSLVNRALDYAVSGRVRNQDAAIQLAIPLETEENRKQAWKYIQSHWDKVQAQLTTNSGSILVGSTGAFCSAASRDEVERFFATHKVAASGQSLKHAIERIDGCVELRAVQRPQLKKWLASQSQPSSGGTSN
jgi:aminopeptidase N